MEEVKKVGVSVQETKINRCKLFDRLLYLDGKGKNDHFSIEKLVNLLPISNRNKVYDFKMVIARLYLVYSMILIAMNGVIALVEYFQHYQMLLLIIGVFDTMIAFILFIYCLKTTKTKDLSKIKYMTSII